jgi:hypothetical protein
MKAIIAVFASVLPFIAPAETLYVQYEGVIVPTNAPLRAGYNIGDRVSGTLLVDSLLAPRTNVQPHNGFAYYGRSGSNSGVDFVTGWITGDKAAQDFVSIEEGFGASLGSNLYQVGDADTHRTLTVYAISPLIKTLDLVQTFDIKEEDPHGVMLGLFEWGRGLVEQAVFRMTRFSVTPGRCRP